MSADAEVLQQCPRCGSQTRHRYDTSGTPQCMRCLLEVSLPPRPETEDPDDAYADEPGRPTAVASPSDTPQRRTPLVAILAAIAVFGALAAGALGRCG